MGVASQWRSGVATDTGLVRASNEDRHWIDDANGIFLVVDGVGGHAAGDVAAETAVAGIREELAAGQGSAEERVRHAIAAANNRIYEMAGSSEELFGMACVLTLAMVDGEDLVIGHVGDSRLYLIWNGSIRKLTSDHSTVGESEDAGELSEAEAMLHPRRNEVVRDVGTHPHAPGDDGFVEVRRCQFKPDAAFLLCSDGLSDRVHSATIRDIVDRYEGDPAAVAEELVQAANDAGGDDNVTALFVAGEQFRGRARHSSTRMLNGSATQAKAGGRTSGWLTGRIAFFLYGILIGFLIWAAMHYGRG